MPTEKRRTPDISVREVRFATDQSDIYTLVSGTSAPTVCSIAAIALVNDVLIAGGEPVYGFITHGCTTSSDTPWQGHERPCVP
jgi:hypothetical protein